MESLILLDSSVLIDYFRKVNKEKAFFFKLSGAYSAYAISVVVHYEILVGSNPKQYSFWKNIFADFFIFSYNQSTNASAIAIGQELRKKRKMMDFKDLVIASIAIEHKLPLATLNKKHFEHIPGLELIAPTSID
jgi:tRNA(fMet)-specific endonuclease VapC